MNAIFMEGMLLQAGLIFALGPQNLFVLESGLRRQNTLIISFVCFFCDFLLIMFGVAGAASFFSYFPQVKIIVGVAGVCFLITYGLGKLRSVDVFGELGETGSMPLRKVILSAITFSVLNPHAYLDGIVLIGGYSSKYDQLLHRVTLGLGAASFSLIWFLLLSYGAGLLLPLFQNPRRMRVIMGSAGVCLIFLSLKLSLDVIGWVQEIYPNTTAALTFTWK